MLKKFAFIAGFAALAMVAADGARAQLALPEGDSRTGEAFALEACSVCHVVSPRQLTSPRIARAVTFRAIANDESMTSLKLQMILSNPHAIMPNLILTPSEVANVIAFIGTLRDRK